MQVIYENNEEFQEYLKDKLKAFNNIHSSHHKEIRKEGAIQYIIVKEEEDGEFLAGATARIYWEMMFLDTLFVEESQRGMGLGNRILKELIGIANKQKSKYIVLETFSFQAKDFYERQGFNIIGAIEDYPPNETYYTMRLNL